MATMAKLAVDIIDNAHSALDSFEPNTSSVLTTESSRVPSERDVEEFLRVKNAEFLKSLAPTLGYILLLMVAGLVGNTVVFLVYYRRFKPSVTRTFILAMCVCDLLTNTLSFPADILEIGFHNTFNHTWACRLTRTVKTYLGCLSASILVAVALDRYRRICRPFSAEQASSKSVFVTLVVCALGTLAITVPYTVLAGRQTVRFEGTNITGFKCSISDVYVKSRFYVIYQAILGVLFLASFVTMATAYMRIVVKLWRHKKNPAVGNISGRAGSRGSSKEAHTYTDNETATDKFGHSLEARPVEGQVDLVKDPSIPGCQGREACLVKDSPAPDSYGCQVDLKEPPMPGSQVDLVKDPPTHLIKDPPESDSHGCQLILVKNLPTPSCRTPQHEETVTKEQPNADALLKTLSSSVDCSETSRFSSPHTPSGVGDTASDDASNNVDVEDSDTTERTTASDQVICRQSTKREKSETDSPPSETNAFPLSPPRATISKRTEEPSCRSKSPGGGRHGKKPTLKARSSVKRVPTRTTFMLFVLTAVFVVSFLPYLVIVSLRSMLELDALVGTLSLNGYHIGIRSYFINSAVNPLVYGLCSARFKQECRRLLHCQAR